MKKLTQPYLASAIGQLRVGDLVLISGKIFTGRDAVHKYLAAGHPSPVNLRQQIIYHCGPVVTEENGQYQVRAAGPTTSLREEPYQGQILRDHGVVGIIGKGGMGSSTLAALQECGAVYFHAIGGAAQVLAAKILQVNGVYLAEKFGAPEAIWDLQVADFPVVVTMDSTGNSLHTQVEAHSQLNLEKILARW